MPRYAECTLTELGSQGSTVTFDPPGTAGTSGAITALRDYSTDGRDIANPAYPTPIELEQITATNTYEPAGFDVSKTVDNGGAVDQDGTPISYGETYDFTASCLFNGVRSSRWRSGPSRSRTARPRRSTSCRQALSAPSRRRTRGPRRRRPTWSRRTP